MERKSYDYSTRLKTADGELVEMVAAHNFKEPQTSDWGWKLHLKIGNHPHWLSFATRQETLAKDSLSSSKRIRNFKVVQDYILDRYSVVILPKDEMGNNITDEHWQEMLAYLIQAGNELAAKAQETKDGQQQPHQR